jgi:hypothetical protein
VPTWRESRSMLFSVSSFSVIQLVQEVCLAVWAVTLTRMPVRAAARSRAALIVLAVIGAAGFSTRENPRPSQSQRIGQSARGLFSGRRSPQARTLTRLPSRHVAA